ncbi:MAG: hypothetical protein HXY34_03395 [Candidatus Thorarchaeota archaeon]|nr:hypothetical protein [Candidatus Thorarchaeota archaeon]
MLDTFLLAVFIVGVLAAGYLMRGGRPGGIRALIRGAVPAPWDLHTFLSRPPAHLSAGAKYLFSEQSVLSTTHHFRGRFDQAVFHREEVPVLDVMIERKFTVKHLPREMREEDAFQAGLYTLALLDTGVSCRNTRLVVIYCLQDEAERCVRQGPAFCLKCRSARVYTKKFRRGPVERAIRKLDQVWFEGRPPRASTRKDRCLRCPYGHDGRCNRSLTR